MTTVGIISDTHGTISDAVLSFLSECNIVLHSGDIGSLEFADRLESLLNLRAVYGNIDNHQLRSIYKEYLLIKIEDVRLLMTHIGGHPRRYEARYKELILRYKPNIVVSGHSHILKVMYDKQLDHLHINPGAAGKHGFHKVRTAIRFKIDGDRIFDLEVGEWQRG